MILSTKALGWVAVAAAFAASTAGAQDKPANYPTKPIRIIISVAPGAGADMVARMTGEILTAKWGQNVIVEPRPGGGGVVASTTAARAEPDGYTLYQNGQGLLMQGATKRVDFDVLKTFEPVARTTSQPYILVVHPRVTANSVKDLIAQSQSGKPMTYAGSSGVGSTVHIGMEKLVKATGAKFRHVAYKGSAPALLALMGGEIDMAATSAMSATAAIKTGKVRGLANLGTKRVPALPDLPTLKEQGINVVIANQYNLWVPAKTPRPIINALNKVVTEGMNSTEYEKRLLASGSEAIDPIPPEELKKMVARDYAELVESVKDLGLKL